MRAFYRMIDHTADVGLEATAGSLEQLLDCCATGMFSLITGGPAPRPQVAERLVLAAHDLPELVVAWLRELLWLHADRDWLYADSRFDELTESSLSATVRGEPVDPDAHRIVREIKAVTYHDLVVERRDGGWFARVIFDV